MSATPIKLTVPGTSLTMQVTKAAMATVGKYPEMVFEGVVEETGEEVSLALPKSSADRQLGRLSLDMASCVGALLTFSRDPNPSGGAAYWGVNWAEPSNLPAKGPIVAPRASQTAKTPPRDDTPHPADEDAPDWSAPTTAGNKLRAVFDLHRECFMHALSLQDLGPNLYTPLTPEALSALTDQVFIRATNLGL